MQFFVIGRQQERMKVGLALFKLFLDMVPSSRADNATTRIAWISLLRMQMQ